MQGMEKVGALGTTLRPQRTQAAYAGSNFPSRSTGLCSLCAASSSLRRRGSFKRGAGPGHRQGRANPQGSFSFLMHSKITHCKFPDCWEEKEGGGGAKLLQTPRWGHPEARIAELLVGPKLLAGRSGFGGLTRKRQNLDTREALRRLRPLRLLPPRFRPGAPCPTVV